jgi:CRISPR-associated protein Cas4
MKISVTLLSSYLYCPRKLFLEKVLMVEEPPKESLVMGSIRHMAYDMINKTEQELVSSIEKEVSLEELMLKYRTAYSKILRKAVLSLRKDLESVNIDLITAYRKHAINLLEEAKERSQNVHSFMADNNVYGDELWYKLTPKILSELRLESEGLKLKGIIDQVHVYEEGHVPIELKTGKAPMSGVWPGHRVQVAAYSMLLAEHFRKPVKEGFVYYLDTKDKRHIAINPYMKEEVISLVNEVIALLEKKEVPDYCDNRNKCTNCGIKSTCYDGKGVEKLLAIAIKQ